MVLTSIPTKKKVSMVLFCFPKKKKVNCSNHESMKKNPKQAKKNERKEIVILFFDKIERETEIELAFFS